MSAKLERKFKSLFYRYAQDESLCSTLWTELYSAYTADNRFYHNLAHLANMIEELEVIEDKISDFDTLLFSVFYHDFIYRPTSNDNEIKSAEIANRRLQMINFPPEKMVKVSSQIRATEQHHRSEDPDTNYLLDADLAVLGRDRGSYEIYRSQIRKEYSVYPDILYKPGRKKVLTKILESKEIYKTLHFRQKYERMARENMQRELGSL
jgi:predicted metal-dependent HD superfamily phosphohydrolase